ncbi:uncharacterized protein LOC143024725 [Oratosquilla oratoria]|uniref:uncharacterized protein LOC143024725 n=1 Tax=Oratosquilla oratoria TaxID=337810 RepID=UPI003F76BAFB
MSLLISSPDVQTASMLTVHHGPKNHSSGMEAATTGVFIPNQELFQIDLNNVTQLENSKWLTPTLCVKENTNTTESEGSAVDIKSLFNIFAQALMTEDKNDEDCYVTTCKNEDIHSHRPSGASSVRSYSRKSERNACLKSLLRMNEGFSKEIQADKKYVQQAEEKHNNPVVDNEEIFPKELTSTHSSLETKADVISMSKQVAINKALQNLECQSLDIVQTKYVSTKVTAEKKKEKERQNDTSVFPCALCPEKFFTVKGLANHVKRHPKSMIGKNECVHCRLKFSSPEKLHLHLQETHQHFICNFLCDACSQECLTADAFDMHNYFQHNSGQNNCFLCKICDKVFYSYNLFLYHNAHQKHCNVCNITFCMSTQQFASHKRRHVLHLYQCTQCDKSYVTKAALTMHLETHCRSIDSLSCEECGKSFGTNEHLQNHKDIHQNENAHKCPVCSCTYTHSKNLKHHLKICHQNFALEAHSSGAATECQGYRCQLCVRTFTWKAQLLRHMRTHVRNTVSQSEEGKWECKVCHKLFKHQRYLVDHSRLHSGHGMHHCKICNQSFLRRNHLAQHLQVHDKSKPAFTCHLCNQSYKRKKDVLTHLRKRHNEEDTKLEVKPFMKEGFPCTECEKVLDTQLQLRFHRVSHEATKPPYICRECQREFSALPALKRHYLKHWGLRPYTCSNCNAAFSHRQTLVRHMVTHTKERSHVCPTCKKAFALRGTLVIHMKLHTREKNSRNNGARCPTKDVPKQPPGNSLPPLPTNKEDFESPVYESITTELPFNDVENGSTFIQECGETSLQIFGNTSETEFHGSTVEITAPSIEVIRWEGDGTSCANVQIIDTDLSPQIRQPLVSETTAVTSSEDKVSTDDLTIQVCQHIVTEDITCQALAGGGKSDEFSMDVLSQALAVTKEEDCQLPSMGEAVPTGMIQNSTMDSNFTSLLTIDHDAKSPMLVNLPHSKGEELVEEEEIMLQVEFPKDGVSNVYVVKRLERDVLVMVKGNTNSETL